MAIANIANVPSTPDEIGAWSLAHQAHHWDMVLTLRTKYSIFVPQYVLSPVDFHSPGAFIDQHQAMHNDIDALFGFPGYDLTGVNFDDAEQFATWIYLNFQSHMLEGGKLGVP